MFAEIFEYNMLCFHLSLFNFQSAIAVFSSVIFSLAVTAWLLYHIFFFLSSTFSKFLEVFFGTRFRSYLITSEFRTRIDSLIFISLDFVFVKTFFKISQKNFFLDINPFRLISRFGTGIIISSLPDFVNSHNSLYKSYFMYFICTPRTAG